MSASSSPTTSQPSHVSRVDFNLSLPSTDQVKEVRLALQTLSTPPTPSDNTDARVIRSLANKQEIETSQVQPAQTQMQTTADAVKAAVKKHFSLWNETSKSLYHLTLEARVKDELFELYWQLKESLELQLNAEISEVRVYPTLGTITYEDVTGQELTIDFLQKNNLVVSHIQTDLDAYLDKINDLTHYRSRYKQRLSPHTKGAVSGPKGLISTALIQKTYPMTLEQLYSPQKRLLFSMIANKPVEERPIIVQRFLMLEEFYEKFREKLDEIIKKQKSQTNAKAEDIKKLEELLEGLIGEGLDAAAVGITLGMYPAESDPSIKDITEAAKKTYDALNDQFKFESNPKKTSEMAWAKDVMGMFFLNRWDYSNFCMRSEIDMKQERLEDLIVKFIINLAAGEDNVGDEFEDFLKIQGFSGGVYNLLTSTLKEITEQLESASIIDPSLFNYKMVIPANANATEIERIQDAAASSAKDDYLTLKSTLAANSVRLVQ